MVKAQTLFKYKIVKGPLHKLPVIIKLFMLIFLSIFCIAFSSFWLGIAILLAVVFAFICGFSLSEQLTDLKPAFFYSAVMYLLSVFSNLTKFSSVSNFQPIFFIPNTEYIRTALRLIFIIQMSAFLFRTTSFLELKECLNMIERFIKRIFRIPEKTFFTDTVSLFLMFIPEFFNIWTGVNLAWKARMGKPGIKKIKTLCFVLITISFEKAAVKAKALEARSILTEVL